ncbi:MAG: preprotein translocase subunit SecE [Planctomycetales bacterium]|nr:preprotein translocase subunit SecE [Planctomycetales bacterium]NIP69416.1 preprotein translocase subunit SecE [Planctomycetales bacterium]
MAEKGFFGSFTQNLLRAAVYKRTQGRVTRQVTFAAIAVTFALGAWSLSNMANPNQMMMLFVVPGLVLGAGAWTAYRIVNWPTFADFLISVEAEMSKVSWPTRTELIRGSVVVLITIASLAVFLYAFDLLWTFIFQRLGVLS